MIDWSTVEQWVRDWLDVINYTFNNAIRNTSSINPGAYETIQRRYGRTYEIFACFAFTIARTQEIQRCELYYFRFLSTVILLFDRPYKHYPEPDKHTLAHQSV